MMTYQNLVGQYFELYEEQPVEVKQGIQISAEVIEDTSIQEVISYINNQETTYCTYSHN